MKNRLWISLVVTGIVLTGCGGGGGGSNTTNTNTNVPQGTYKVSVIDDHILGSIVSAPECASYTDNGNGVYTLKECIAMPSTITAVGGYIDTNGNNKQDANETDQVAPLKLKVSQSGLSNSFMVTPLSTLATQEANLTALANSLGIDISDFFKDNPNKRNLQRSINALLIAARSAGITKYDTFIKDFEDRIVASTKTGLLALSDAKQYMKDNEHSYQSKYGIVFGGFVDDTSGIDLSNGLAALEKANGTNVPAGKVRLGGFIYDDAIAYADVRLYDGTTVLATTSSDANGRYFLDINASLLLPSKVFTIEAMSGTTKLIAYITTDELKAGLIGKKISNAQIGDLIVSNVTTAKAVLVEKTAPAALNDAKQMVEAKTRVEQLYSNDLVMVAAAIKDVVDNNKTISQTDTTAFAQNMVDVNATTKAPSVTIPTGIDANVTAVTTDPILDEQLNNTQVVDEGNLKSIMLGHTLYSLDYREGSNRHFEYDSIKINSDGSSSYKEFRYDENSSQWTLNGDYGDPAGSITWSDDGSKLYSISDDYLPEKHSLVSSETINYQGRPVHIYITEDTVTAEPTEGFFRNFVTNAEDSGSLNFTSMQDANKTFTINYDGGNNVVAYALDDNGTYRQGELINGEFHSFQNNSYRYRIVVKNSKTYIIFDDGQTNDGGGNIFYLDFANQKVYKKDYHNIGFKDTSIFFDNYDIVDYIANLSSNERQNLSQNIEDQLYRQNYSATYTQYMATQQILYDFIKSLAD
ncbi:hypothetical protein MNB_SM-6-101 [hydrothermal vent metagenome]|uniref:Uncharacterized protein n=1 Tax=hydrothermal vent metagenome TaxID=652676 RepID=A0A1W1C8V3_9ZZZZ